MNNMLGSYSLHSPITKNKTVKATNPISWIGIRPHLSTKATVSQYPGTVPRKAISKFPCTNWMSKS